jgi:hypothetical protein
MKAALRALGLFAALAGGAVVIVLGHIAQTIEEHSERHIAALRVLQSHTLALREVSTEPQSIADAAQAARAALTADRSIDSINVWVAESTSGRPSFSVQQNPDKSEEELKDTAATCARQRKDVVSRVQRDQSRAVYLLSWHRASSLLDGPDVDPNLRARDCIAIQTIFAGAQAWQRHFATWWLLYLPLPPRHVDS